MIAKISAWLSARGDNRQHNENVEARLRAMAEDADRARAQAEAQAERTITYYTCRDARFPKGQGA